MYETKEHYVLVGLVRTTAGCLVRAYAENLVTASSVYFLDDTDEVFVIDGLDVPGMKAITTENETKQLVEFYEELERTNEDAVGVVMAEQGYVVLTDIVVGGGYYCPDGVTKQELPDVCVVTEDPVDTELLALMGADC